MIDDQKSRTAVAGQPSSAARQASEWFRQLAQLVRIARTYGPYAPLARQARDRLIKDMLPLLQYHSPLVLRFAPLEIWLEDELLLRAQADDEGGPSLENQLPFILHRDGLRGMTLAPETTRDEIVAIVSSVIEITTSKITHDDICTLLWRADLPHVHVDSAPLQISPEPEQPAAATCEPVAGDEAPFNPWVDTTPYAKALKTSVPMGPGTAGLAGTHREDWILPDRGANAASLWRQLQLHEEPASSNFLEQWRAEDAIPWEQGVAGFVRDVVHVEPSTDMRRTLAESIVTWIAGAVQRCDWNEAQHAFEVLHTLDNERVLSNVVLRNALDGLDFDAIASQLDEAGPEDQARFFALVVNAGASALDLTVGVLGRAGRARLRAAATTALSYMCNDDPQLLAPYLADSRWHVVRNIAFVLGQIGGTEVTALLARAARHLDARVRRAAVIALAQVPSDERIPLLLEHLDTHDPQLLTNMLTMLTREQDTRVALSLLARINANDFETRSDDHKLALIEALADVADEGAVPALSLLLQKGGWFARRTPERSAIARTLARIGSPTAMHALEEGRHSRADAVRAACMDALNFKVRP
ncbi:MAG: HEAT repeat domain-containing protein [Candidatus Eisenbacteria bacterium]